MFATSGIEVLDIFLFDTSGILVEHHKRTRAQLSRFPVSSNSNGSTRPGMQLMLPPGDYRVVVWANAIHNFNPFVNVEIGNHIDNMRFANSYSNGEDFPSNGQPLHFAGFNGNDQYFTFTMPEIGEEYGIISFQRAHNEIQVWVVNPQNIPTIYINGAYAKFDFNMEVDDSIDPITFRNHASRNGLTPDGLGNIANWQSFYVPLFDENTNKTITLRANGTPLIGGEISIRDFLNGIDMTGVYNPNNITEIADVRYPSMVIPIIVEVAPDPSDPTVDIVVSVRGAHWQVNEVEAPHLPGM